MNAIVTLLSYVYRQARGVVALAMLVGLLSGVAAAAQIAVINAAIYRDGAHARLLLAIAFGGLLLLAPASRMLSQYLLVKLGQDVIYDLRLHLAERILATPLHQLERLGPSKLLVALTDDTSAITESLISVPDTASNLALFGAGLIYLGYLSLPLLGVFLVLFIPTLVGYRGPIASSFERYRLAREEDDALFGHFTGLTSGTKELKLNQDRRRAFMGQLAGTADRLRRLFTRANLTLAGTVSGAWVFFMAAVGLIVFGAPLFGHVSRETLVGFALVLLFVRGPLQLVLGSFTALGRGGVALSKLERLGIELQASAEPEAAPRPERATWRRLELDGVTFTFRREAGEADFVLGPIDLTIEPGELIFLIGGNGSGKTSFAKLLLGLYEPDSGAIRFDGERVERGALDRYRQNFSAVFFDFFLFADLVGVHGDDLDEVSRRHLRDLQLERKVRVEDGRLSTTALSQGQRKRLALLAAYLEDRPIYLFDEWAADQDPAFKEVFYRRLLPQLQAAGKTVVVISHDDRYFGLADRIIRLDEGRVVFDGPVHDPEELREALVADLEAAPLHERIHK